MGVEPLEKIRIGEKIRLLRKKNDVTQDQLASHLGVTPQAVSRWESGVCYPDMSSLPAIADYFSVSMDELLCYSNSQKEKKVRDYLTEAEALLNRDRVVEALELLRTAMAEIPSSCPLRLEAAQVLSLYARIASEKLEQSLYGKETGGLHSEPPGKDHDTAAGKESSQRAIAARAAIQAALGEAVSLCHHILEDSTDDRLRDETKKTLCDIYAHQLGDHVQALEMAEQFHSMDFCQEIIKATVLTGDVAFDQAQRNLMLFADNIWWHLYNLACVPDISGDRYTAEEKITLLQKGVDLLNLIFDDQPLFYASRLANSYRQLALLHASAGNDEAALDDLEHMADWAVAFDRRPEQAVYSSVLINRVHYDRAEDTDLPGSQCLRLLRSVSANRAFTCLSQFPRFRAVLERLEAEADIREI